MDPSVIAAEPSGLEAWIVSNQALLQMIQFASQILFWIGMLVLVGYAVAQYKRWVNFQLGVGRSGKLRKDHESSSDEKPSVDEFVD